MSGFNLEKFSQIIKKEISESMLKVYDENKADLEAGKYNKKPKQFKPEDVKKDDLVKTLNNVF